MSNHLLHLLNIEANIYLTSYIQNLQVNSLLVHRSAASVGHLCSKTHNLVMHGPIISHVSYAHCDKYLPFLWSYSPMKRLVMKRTHSAGDKTQTQ